MITTSIHPGVLRNEILTQDYEAHLQGVSLRNNDKDKMRNFFEKVTGIKPDHPQFALAIMGSTTTQIILYPSGTVIGTLPNTGHKRDIASDADIMYFHQLRTQFPSLNFFVVGSAFDGIGVISSASLLESGFSACNPSVNKFVNDVAGLTENLWFVDAYSIKPRPIYKHAIGAIMEMTNPDNSFTLFVDGGGSGPKTSIFQGTTDVTKHITDFPKEKVPSEASEDPAITIANYQTSLTVMISNLQKWFAEINPEINNVIVLFTGKIRDIYNEGKHTSEIDAMMGDFSSQLREIFF